MKLHYGKTFKKKNPSVCVNNTDIHNGVRKWVGTHYVYRGHTLCLYRCVSYQ